MDTPAPAPAAAPLTATDFMGKLTAAFSAKESLVRDNAALTTQVTALTADLAAAQTAATEATAAKTAAEGQVAELTTKVTALNTQLTDFCATLGFKPEELAGKDAAALKSAFNSRIEVRSLSGEPEGLGAGAFSCASPRRLLRIVRRRSSAFHSRVGSASGTNRTARTTPTAYSPLSRWA